MFAIKFTEANLPKILQTDNLTVAEAQALTELFFKRDYVFIRGYQSERGGLEEWAIMPWFIFRDNFDYDPDNINIDWDLIVRL